MTNKTEDKTEVDKYKLSKKYLTEVDGFTAFKICRLIETVNKTAVNGLVNTNIEENMKGADLGLVILGIVAGQNKVLTVLKSILNQSEKTEGKKDES